jgi:hypothetical protein
MLAENVRRLRRPGNGPTASGRRWKTNWPAELHSHAGVTPCTVIDISSVGAQLRLESAPAERSRVLLFIANIGAIAADVVWCKESAVGLQFLEQQPWIQHLHAQRLDPTTWRSNPQHKP